MRKLIVLAAFALVAIAPAAQALEAGDGLYGIQITNGKSDLYYVGGAGGTGYLANMEKPELGLGLQYWRLMSKDYAFTMSGGIGFYKETFEPGDDALATGTDYEFTTSSWNVRVGGDRVVQVGERATFYFGPGIEYWTGKWKEKGGAGDAAEIESEAVSRFALSGRLGGIMWLSDRTGFNCQLGRFVGLASAEDVGARASWWTSGFQASGGLVLKF
jgi:hypothetical protein